MEAGSARSHYEPLQVRILTAGYTLLMDFFDCHRIWS